MTVFDVLDYRDFLAAVLPTSGDRRGQRVRYAKFLNCQKGFISQVLLKNRHLSLEHAYDSCEFLQLTKHEQDFFLNVFHFSRAGNERLKSFFKDKIDSALAERTLSQSRVKITRRIEPIQEAIYYSQWYYSAIHMLAAIPELQSAPALAQRLNLSLRSVSQAIEFLVEAGLLRAERGKIQPTDKFLHLGRQSPHLARHLANWRTKVLQRLDGPWDEDIHYSAVISLPRDVVPQIRDLFLQLLQDVHKAVPESGEDTGLVMNLDLFHI